MARRSERHIDDSRRGEGERLGDTASAANVDWREASALVSSSYRAWDQADSGRSGSWFAAYVAALDREERASEAYAHAIKRAGQHAEGEQRPWRARSASPMRRSARRYSVD